MFVSILSHNCNLCNLLDAGLVEAWQEYVRPKQPIVQKLKLLRQFRARLRPHLAVAAKARTEEDPRCQVLAEDYFCLLLFGLFNPALRSMRALCRTSGRLSKMREVCSRPIAPASFSEGQHVFDPEILATMVANWPMRSKAGRSLVTVVCGRRWKFSPPWTERCCGPSTVCGLRWVKNGSAVKLHLHFSVFDQGTGWVSPGHCCRRKVLKSSAAGRVLCR